MKFSHHLNIHLQLNDISSLLTYVSEHHERHTRSAASDSLHIPRSHSSYYDKAFSVQGPNYGIIYYQTSEICSSTVNRFKSVLKQYLLNCDLSLTIPSCSETGLTYRHFIPVSRFRIYFRNFRTEISCLRWSIGIKYLYS